MKTKQDSFAEMKILKSEKEIDYSRVEAFCFPTDDTQ